MKIHTVVLALCCAVFIGSCGNPWMEKTVKPLFEEENNMGPLTGSVSISGILKVGMSLTANVSLGAGSGTLYYQWKRDGADIPGAMGVSNTYLLTAADDGRYITVTVTRSDNSGSLTSAPVGPVVTPT
ncbi:MAG: hypothetical protein LBB82_01345 [Treponema sp.]|jgi:hypothetical protein|nr:hypothetical protein [Treponema sp.]